MAVEARIRELGVRHQTLEREIEDENRRPLGHPETQGTKRQKLKLKEEMENLRRARRLH